MAVKVRQKSGKWWVFIDHKGKRKAKCIGDKRAAEQLKAKLEAKIALGEFELEEDQERLSFSTYYRSWLETYVKNHTKAATYASYELAYRVHLLPFFGNTDIRHITRQQLKRLIFEKLNGGLARNSLRGYLAPLREMFNHAIEDG